MPEPFPAGGPVAVRDPRDQRDDGAEDDPDVGDEALAQADHELGQAGELILPSELREHLAEGRDDPGEHDHDHRDGDEEDGHRIDHRSADLPLQLDVLLDVDREALEDRVQDAAHLAGGDEVHEEVVEDLRVLAEPLGEGAALLDVDLDLLEDRVEALVLTLGREDVETLHEGQTGVDHRRELPREDHQLGGLHRRADDDVELLGLLLDLDRVQLLCAEARLNQVGAVRLHHALADFTIARPRFPAPFGHSGSTSKPRGSRRRGAC